MNVDVGPIGSGKTVVLTLVVTPLAGAAGQFTTAFSVQGENVDSNSTNNTASASVPGQRRGRSRSDDRARARRPERRFELDLYDLGQQPRALGCHRRDGLFAGAQRSSSMISATASQGRRRSSRTGS